MKNFTLRLGLAIFILLSCTFCSSSDDGLLEETIDVVENKPGEIPGLGETEGELTGTPFVLPKGASLVGKINGYAGREIYPERFFNSRKFANRQIETDLNRQTTNTQAEIMVGSGGIVEVAIELKNTTNEKVVVKFPARLVLKAEPVNGRTEFQNGILLKDTQVVLPPNKTTIVALTMYCANAERLSSSRRAEYKWTVISNSAPLVDLTNRLVDKKINFEEYTKDEMYADGGYYDITYELQMILWYFTDNLEELQENWKEYINQLPDSKK